MYQRVWSLLFLMSFAFIAQAQINSPLVRDVEMSFDDSTVVAHIYTKAYKKATLYPLMYYWYYQDKLGQSQNGFLGYLLHNDYCVYDKKMRLIRKGNFVYGLKDGLWKSWYTNGILRVNEEWKKGLPNGTWNYYSSDGKIIKTINYNKGVLSGKYIVYQGDSCIIHNYTRGKEKISKPWKWPFLHKRTAQLKQGEIHSNQDSTNH